MFRATLYKGVEDGVSDGFDDGNEDGFIDGRDEGSKDGYRGAKTIKNISKIIAWIDSQQTNIMFFLVGMNKKDYQSHLGLSPGTSDRPQFNHTSHQQFARYRVQVLLYQFLLSIENT